MSKSFLVRLPNRFRVYDITRINRLKFLTLPQTLSLIHQTEVILRSNCPVMSQVLKPTDQAPHKYVRYIPPDWHESFQIQYGMTWDTVLNMRRQSII